MTGPRLFRLVLSLLLLAILGAAHADPSWIADGKGCKHINEFPKPNEAVTWTGSCIEGWAEGNGTQEWFRDGKAGSRYTGGMKHGSRSGQGTDRFPNGAAYEGNYRDGKLQGHGIMRDADGYSVEGDFVEGKVKGPVIGRAPNGGGFEGCIDDEGLPTGRVVLRMPDGDTYEGDFIAGRPTGRGVHRWSDGRVSEAEIVDGKIVDRPANPDKVGD